MFTLNDQIEESLTQYSPYHVDNNFDKKILSKDLLQ